MKKYARKSTGPHWERDVAAPIRRLGSGLLEALVADIITGNEDFWRRVVSESISLMASEEGFVRRVAGRETIADQLRDLAEEIVRFADRPFSSKHNRYLVVVSFLCALKTTRFH